MKRVFLLSLCLVSCRATESPREPAYGVANEAVEGEDPGWSPPVVSNSPPSSPDAPNSDRLVAEAVRELRAMQSTRYRHRTRVEEDNGTFEFDCSGFVAYALAHADPSALLRVPPGPKGRPRAEDFTAFFAGLSEEDPAWKPIRHGADVAPGDVVAWLRPADVESTNTGHMAIVLDRVGIAPASSAVATIGGVREILLRVADSTESPHSDDVRGPNTTTGLGTGIIGLVVDGSDAPIGYRWRGGKSPKAFATMIAVARLR